MKKAVGLILLTMLLFNCSSRSQVKPAVNNLQVTEGFEQNALDTIAKFIKDFPNNTQLAIATVKNDKVFFLGVLRQNDTLLNVRNENAAFEIGSITKVFTSTLLVDLAQEGKVNIGDPIQNYLSFTLKEASRKEKPITLQTLANHTSGLPRLPNGMTRLALLSPDNPYKNYGEQELQKDLSEKVKLNSVPGEKYAYSNLGAGSLGYILSQQAGKSYEALLQERIFQPLGMKNSTTDRAGLRAELVKGLNEKGEVTSNWDLNALAGAGAILSTVEDLSKFVQANFQENPKYELQRASTFTVNNNMDVALGWHIIKTKGGRTWHWHNGGTGGYTSSMAIDINDKSSIIILSNVSAFNKKMGNIDQLSFELMKIIR